MTERVAFTFAIRPEALEEYRKAHTEMSGELRSAISSAGFRNYTIFLVGSQVVGYAECEPDRASAFAMLAANPLAAQFNIAAEPLLATENGSLVLQFGDEVWHLN